MKGTQAFSPTSGAPLSREKHRPGELHEAPAREADDGSGELTLGGRRSSRTALQQYWGRSYRKSHHGLEVPTDVAMAAGMALYKLKRQRTNPTDHVVWLALCERLARRGHWSTWMFNHADPTCPRCGSVCRVKPNLTGIDNVVCGSNCGAGTHNERSIEIVDRVLDLYNAAFETPIGRLETVTGIVETYRGRT